MGTYTLFGINLVGARNSMVAVGWRGFRRHVNMTYYIDNLVRQIFAPQFILLLLGNVRTSPLGSSLGSTPGPGLLPRTAPLGNEIIKFQKKKKNNWYCSLTKILDTALLSTHQEFRKIRIGNLYISVLHKN